MSELDQASRDHHALIASDSVFQRRLRLAQSLWREDRGIPMGTHRDSPLGSRIDDAVAESELPNYLTDTIRDVLREELDGADAQGKLFSRPRIFNDLLSSQPLCFNIFGELAADTSLATKVCRLLWPERVAAVDRVRFEYSPGRGDDRYLGNRTAFDLYIEHQVPGGGHGFIGIEVKYHENLKVSGAEVRDRAREVADAAGIFPPEHRTELESPPLQQVWFDHLLALSMLEADDWDTGLFIFLYPVGNARCAEVSRTYAKKLSDRSTFETRTLEEIVGALRWTTDAGWVRELDRRYLRPATGRLT